MSTLEHTSECDARYARIQEAAREYDRRWPEHCTDCEGRGAFYVPGGFYEPPNEDPCGLCWERGKCPRCGMTDAFASEGADPPCLRCGWMPEEPARPSYECCGCVNEPT